MLIRSGDISNSVERQQESGSFLSQRRLCEQPLIRPYNFGVWDYLGGAALQFKSARSVEYAHRIFMVSKVKQKSTKQV